jgi:hypothetical protein
LACFCFYCIARVNLLARVKHVLDGGAAGGVGFTVGFESVIATDVRGFRIRLAALRTAVGEAGLAGFQFELLATGDAGFDGEGHDKTIINAALSPRAEGALRIDGRTPAVGSS